MMNVKFLSLALALLLGLTSHNGWKAGGDTPAAAHQPGTAVTEQITTPENSEPASNAPGYQYIDGINRYTVLDLDVGAFYDFRDHAYMSSDWDREDDIPYDVYYGMELQVVNGQYAISWHNYTDMDIRPVTFNVTRLADGKTSSFELDLAQDTVKTLNTNNSSNGPYGFSLDWTNGKTTTIYGYKNGDSLYTCRYHDDVTAARGIVDAQKAIVNLIDHAGYSMEENLNYSDAVWAYPVPADYATKYGSGYRCDNQRWIGLAQELTDDSMTDAQKAIVIYDWMRNNLIYDEYKFRESGLTRAMEHNDYSGKYSMWDTHIGVCADFATVYCMMLRSVGVPTLSVDYGSIHVWNLVYLDGCWNVVDTTSDILSKAKSDDITDISYVEPNKTRDHFGVIIPFEDTYTGSRYVINAGIYTRAFVTGTGNY